MRIKRQISHFSTQKRHEPLKNSRSGLKSPWPFQSFLSPALPPQPGQTGSPIKEQRRVEKRSGFMSGCLRGWVAESSSPYRVTRPLRLPIPRPVTAPVWASGGRPPIPGDSPALRSIRPGAFGAKRWRKQGTLWVPVASPAGSLSAEHLTLCCSPPRSWNAIGSCQLVIVTRKKNLLLGVAVLPVN